MNPFITPNKILEDNKKYKTHTDSWLSDNFFIDKKYRGKIGLSVSKKKLNNIFIWIVIIILILFARIFYLQIIENKKYYSIAEGNRIKTEIIPTPRGIFFDRNKNALVENIPEFSLFVDKKSLAHQSVKQSNLIKKISKITEMPYQKILDEISRKENQSKQDILISRRISYQQAMVIQANPEKYASLKLQLTPERRYDDQHGLSHILGYLGKIDNQEWEILRKFNYQFFDMIGRAGLEKEYEKMLRGQPGRIEKEVDAQGKIIKTVNIIKPIPSKNLVLTIDEDLNEKLNQALARQLKKIGCSKAAGIALNPQTGEILALVSLPSFNNNFFSEPQKFDKQIKQILNRRDQPLFNRAISGEYPPGSTFKLVVGSAALQEGIVNEWTQILSTGGIRINKWFYPDWKSGGHGLTNITRALAESINTFFYYVGGGYQNFKGLGLERIINYAHKFYLGRALGIDLPNEASGFLPNRNWKKKTKNEPWYIGDTYHLSIGQGDILVTPLQIASLTATIANGGKVFKPHLVKEIVDVDKNKTTVIQPEIISQGFVSEKNIKIIQKGLRQAVLSGSARSLSSLPVTSAGKTGTAQVSGGRKPHAWFTVFAPYKNPKIALTILIENGGEGNAVALPVAKEVLRWYFGIYLPAVRQ